MGEQTMDATPVEGETLLAGYSNRKASKPGQHGTPFLESRTLSDPRSTTVSNQQGGGAQPATSPRDPSASSNQQETPTPVEGAPPDPGSSSQGVKDCLRPVNACFYYAYGVDCPYSPCTFKHEAARSPRGHYRSATDNYTLTVVDAVEDVKDAYNVTPNSRSRYAPRLQHTSGNAILDHQQAQVCSGGKSEWMTVH